MPKTRLSTMTTKQLNAMWSRIDSTAALARESDGKLKAPKAVEAEKASVEKAHVNHQKRYRTLAREKRASEKVCAA